MSNKTKRPRIIVQELSINPSTLKKTHVACINIIKYYDKITWEVKKSRVEIIRNGK